MILTGLFPSIGRTQKSPFSAEALQPSVDLKAGEEGTLSVQIDVPPQHYIYRDKTEVEFVTLEGLHVGAPIFPKPVLHEDPFVHKKTEAYLETILIEIPLHVPAETRASQREISALVHLQGCSDRLCYPLQAIPVSWTITVVAPVGGVADAIPAQRGSLGAWIQWVRHSSFDDLLRAGWGWTVLAVWVGGLLTALTPCVLPIIPITLLIIGVGAQAPLRKNLLLSLMLVLGMALTYAVLGVMAVIFGKSLGFVFQQPWFVWFVVFLLIYLALAMFGWVPLQLPASVSMKLSKLGGRGLKGAFLAGMGTGLLAAPCVGPVMAPLLLFVAASQKFWIGFGLLFVYALGMGSLFLALGTGYGYFQGRLRGSSVSAWIKTGLGIALFAAAGFYLNSVVPIEKTISKIWQKPDITWIDNLEEGIQNAKAQNKPVLVDFYADWCLPCKELEQGFFRRPEIVVLLQQMVTVRIDATTETPELMALLEKYQVVGWPTILFFDAQGNPLKDLTVAGYDLEKLENNLKRVTK